MQPYIPNFVGMLIAVVARGVLGSLWYSPLLFVKPWMKLTGISEKEMQKGMLKCIIIDVLVNGFLIAFVLAHAIHYANAQGTGQGMAVGFFNWLGFMATLGLGNVLFEKKPFKLFMIDAAYQLVFMLVMGAVLVHWQ